MSTEQELPIKASPVTRRPLPPEHKGHPILGVTRT
jgi:hypothetical protein